MIYSKFLALSLLLVSPFALARVNLNTNMEINNPFPQQTIINEVQLDTNVSVVVYDANNMRVEAELLQEQENDALVRYTVSAKNAEGVYEAIATPELAVVYGQASVIKLGQKSAEGDQAGFLTVIANASKI